MEISLYVKIVARFAGFHVKMFRVTAILVLSLAASALCKVRTSKRPGFMAGNPLYDPVWEDGDKIVGGYEVGVILYRDRQKGVAVC